MEAIFSILNSGLRVEIKNKYYTPVAALLQQTIPAAFRMKNQKQNFSLIE